MLYKQYITKDQCNWFLVKYNSIPITLLPIPKRAMKKINFNSNTDQLRIIN